MSLNFTVPEVPQEKTDLHLRRMQQQLLPKTVNHQKRLTGLLKRRQEVLRPSLGLGVVLGRLLAALGIMVDVQ